ncbi:MAG: hypothetical protein ACOVSW_23205 [Candidatus Kapaibacteriota bacterium]|jgi:hypothetical protein
MKLNKTALALYGGITAGFFALGTLYVLFGGAAISKTDVAIIFSLSATLLASWAVLAEGRHKKEAKSICTKDADTVTLYVP